MPISIQPLTAEHIPAAKHVIRTVWREHFGEHPNAFVRTFLDSDIALQDLDEAHPTYFENGGVVLVVLADGSVVGTGAVLRIDDELCELKRMFLLREYRGQGLGRKLGEELLRFARAQGYRRMRLGSNKELTASHALYRKLGFKPIPAYEPDGERYAYYMERDLS
jgi:GNAT superfamily N-acetyltransferase